MTKSVRKDVITMLEEKFPFPRVLMTPYFTEQKEIYYSAKKLGLLNSFRNYWCLLQFLNEINDFNPQHAKSYVKRLQQSKTDWKNSEAIFAEVIVYRYHIRAFFEGYIHSIRLDAKECDLIIERADGSLSFIEVFCIMPLRPDELDNPLGHEIKTHTQFDRASVRQKLLMKIFKQAQLKKPRENIAIIEINDYRIAGDFAILSSLSDGYKVRLNIENYETTSEGYDWNQSIFSEDVTSYIKEYDILV